MTTSLNFDRAASIYDHTREFPPAVATDGIQAIVDAIDLGRKALEVGAGTGRISVELLRRGLDLSSCDISRKMMAVLQAKVRGARLAQADASHLPFPDAAFDAVITCHVMHLVGPWREALYEFSRVLKTGAPYINARTEWSGASPIGEHIDRFWEERVVKHGASWKRPGAQSTEELLDGLRDMGANVASRESVRYLRSTSAEAVLARLANRVDSQTWGVPEDIHRLALQETREWAKREFGDLGSPFDEESAFILDIVRFSAVK